MKITDAVVAAATRAMREIEPTQHSEDEKVRAMLEAANEAWWTETVTGAARAITTPVKQDS